MGAWGEGMQASDSALDAIVRFRLFDEKKDTWALNKLGNDIVAGKRALKGELKKLRCRQGILGAAEYFMDLGVDVKPAKSVIMEALEFELCKDQLENWVSPKARKAALLRFKARLNGKKVSKKLIEKDNEGLLSKMARMLR